MTTLWLMFVLGLLLGAVAGQLTEITIGVAILAVAAIVAIEAVIVLLIGVYTLMTD